MKRWKILLVDDDALIRRVLHTALSSYGAAVEVREARDGYEGVEVCREFEPDVIVLDYWMPRMDGATAAIIMRALQPTARIVAYSGVLNSKPDWADDHYVKGELPNLDAILS